MDPPALVSAQRLSYFRPPVTEVNGSCTSVLVEIQGCLTLGPEIYGSLSERAPEDIHGMEVDVPHYTDSSADLVLEWCNFD